MTTTVAFGNLYQACQKHGLHARLHTYDGGQTIYITRKDNGAAVFQWSSEWGDAISPTEEATEWLIGQGLINATDLEG